MKTLTTLSLASLFVTSAAFADQTVNVEQATAALVKQQNAHVSQTVANQVNLDIQYALRAMQLPKVAFDQSMLAKTANQVEADSTKPQRGE